MNPSSSSRTAEYIAFFRALESVRTDDKRLFEDLFAVRFLRFRLRWAVRLAHVPVLASLVDRSADSRLPEARTSAIARTRFIDNAVRGFFSLDQGQLVLLGPVSIVVPAAFPSWLISLFSKSTIRLHSPPKPPCFARRCPLSPKMYAL
jgi:hypothetical protein